jgi:hypothetical protein
MRKFELRVAWAFYVVTIKKIYAILKYACKLQNSALENVSCAYVTKEYGVPSENVGA